MLSLNPPELTTKAEEANAAFIVKQLHDAQTSDTPDTSQFSLPALIHAAIQLIHSHDYTGEGPVRLSHPVSSKELVPITADAAETTMAKKYLSAFVLVSRGLLHENVLDAQTAQRRFIENTIFKCRHQLYRLFRNLYTIVEDTRADSKAGTLSTPASRKSTPKSSRTVKEKVHERDQYLCKMSGALKREFKHLPRENVNLLSGICWDLEVTHGAPPHPRENYQAQIEALFGVRLPTSGPDCVENALLLHAGLRSLFCRFSIGFRRADPVSLLVLTLRDGELPKQEALDQLLGMNTNVTQRTGDSLEGRPLLPSSPDCGVADPDPFWFHLHWVVGDIFWMTDGAEPRGFGVGDEDEEGARARVLNDETIHDLLERISVLEREGYTYAPRDNVN
ncbi:hypothetical protein FPV67DRAFT_1489902 [Lyophyllum atratum]|nr:hypothetical protein FPV67DRAFT_1489902 [Lyophyllum atratum]